MGLALLLLAAALALAPAGMARGGEADWPEWRGPSRDGVTPEASGWPTGWPPKKLWSRNVGKGCTSPVLVDGKLYVLGWAGRGRAGTDTLACFDARSGRELWKQSYPCPYQGRVRTGDEGAYGGPSSTPTFDAATGLLYTLSVDGDLRCWDTAQQGKLAWARNLYDDFKVGQRPSVGGGRRDYGYTSSPLVRGDLLLVEVGAAKGTVMAFEKKTGRGRWASQYNKPAGHNGGPVPMEVDGADCIALLALHDLVVMRVDAGHEGQTVATTKWETEFACNVPTPAVADDRVLVTSEYNHSTATLFEVSAKGLRQRWTSAHHALASSPVIYRDRVYLMKGALQCLDLATGALKWRGGDFGDGSCLVTAADNKLIAFGSGKLALLEALPADNRYRELSRLDRVVPATCYPYVTLSRGVLCCKDRDGNLVCYSVRPGPEGATEKR